MASGKVSDDNFDRDVLQAAKPVLVDFWAEWCGPCKSIGPAIEELSSELNEAIEVVKINIDENPMTTGRFGIRGVPTLMIFKQGKVAATQVGAISKNRIREWIDQTIQAGAMGQSAEPRPNA